VPNVVQGSIIRANVTDPSGGNAKLRPLVVLTGNSELATADSFVAAAVTKSVGDPPADDEVLLPWHPSGRCRTRLTVRCGAKCSWLREIKIADVAEIRGHCPAAELELILRRVAELGS
jgi:hypothetical protein